MAILPVPEGSVSSGDTVKSMLKPSTGVLDVRVMVTGTVTDVLVVEIVPAGETASTVVWARADPDVAALIRSNDARPTVSRDTWRNSDWAIGISEGCARLSAGRF
jgi:hypothetical protein